MQVKQSVVTFAVEEVFRGPHVKSVDVVTFVASSMCGYSFREGTEYLVDAFPASDASAGSRWEVSSCGLTATKENAADTVEFLSALKAHPEGGIIFGTVKAHAPGANFLSAKNWVVADAEVRIDSDLMARRDTITRRVLVDANGWYGFVGLPEGSYSISVEVPIRYTGVLKHRTELGKNGCSQVDVKVIDRSGK